MTKTILKTKTILITAELLITDRDKNEFDNSNYSKLAINELGKFIEIEADEYGKIIMNDALDEDLIGKSLYGYARTKVTDYYKQLLQTRYSEIENLVILAGAGSSVGIGADKKGLTMAGLWDELKNEDLASLTQLIKSTHSDWIKDNKIIKEEKDLEALLSLAVAVNRINNTEKLKDAIVNTKKFIVDKCTLNQPDDSPHRRFLSNIMLRPQKSSRVKLFTTNYDTLFEQAAIDEMFTVIDGFTFSTPRVFNGKYFDYDIIETCHNRQDQKDNIIPKLFYLYKMHGSLDWKFKDDHIEQCDISKIELDDRTMIFPQDSKFEHSYEQPYFEMMSRFQQSLRSENTLLITIGFSFLDKHISSVIVESLKQNPSLNLMSFTYPEIISSEKSYQNEIHKIANLQSRVILIADTFSSLSSNYPTNTAHNRFDLLEELNENLKKVLK